MPKSKSKELKRAKREIAQAASDRAAAIQAAANRQRNAWRPRPMKKKKSGLTGVIADLIGGAVSAGGAALGQPAIGSALGSGLSAGIKAIWGSGAYHVDKNTILSGDANYTFRTTDRGVRIGNREFVGLVRSGSTLVNGATEFQNTSFLLNPGNAKMAPWLAKIATNNFAKYEWHGLVFEYVPTSGASVASANTALGVIAGSVNPDPNDDPWTSLTEMLHAQNSLSTVPSNSALFPVECARSDQVTELRFISNYAPDGELDPRLIAPGTFQLATSGQQAPDTDLGEFWVTYEVELIDPIMEGGTLGVEGIFNPAGTPTRVLENATAPVTYTVNQYYQVEGNVMTFLAPFEGIVVFHFGAVSSAITIVNLVSNRPTTFLDSLVGTVYDPVGSSQFTVWMMKADAGTIVNLAGVSGPPTFTTRVYMSPFPFGTQYWPAVFGPRTRNRALRAMPRRVVEPDRENEPTEDDIVPVSRPPSPAPSNASSRRSFVRV